MTALKGQAGIEAGNEAKWRLIRYKHEENQRYDEKLDKLIEETAKTSAL
jgi:hypothetical protein